MFRDNVGGISTKSYHCDVAGGGALTATFMRLSDVMFDGAGGPLLPVPVGELQGLMRGHQLVNTPTLAAFTRLFEAYSFAFEPTNIEMAYDMRDPANSGREEIVASSLGDEVGRWRTLGM